MTLSHRELLIGGALVACSYVDRLACGLRRRVRAHLHAQPSAPRAAAHERGELHRVYRRSTCAVCRACPAVEGDVCESCDVWLISLAYVNRDACERAS